MQVFCDSLTFGMFAKVVWLRIKAPSGIRLRDIQVLDPISKNIRSRVLIVILKFLGFTVQEPEFFDGHLITDTGESVSMAAIRRASDTALLAAEQIVSNSTLLSELNEKWGRNTISLDVSRDIWPSIRDRSARVMVASVLTREAGAERAVMVVARTRNFDRSFLVEIGTNLDMHFYSPGLGFFKHGRAFLVAWLLRQQIDRLAWRTQALVRRLTGRSTQCVSSDPESPSILLIQEGEVSLDRSYRTQPHWLFEIDGRQPYRTYILEDPFVAASQADSLLLEEQGIQLVSRKDISLTKYQGPPLPIQRQLTRDLRKCIMRTLLSRSDLEVSATISIGRVLYTASLITEFCRKANVKAFLTGANYYREVDAIQMIAPTLGIHTLSYQISNHRQPAPGLLTNADTMFVFSPLYHGLWTNDGIHPRSFVDIGYPYDTSFNLVRPRAQQSRSELQAAGAKFIICYFDENPTISKYGNVSIDDNNNELLALMRLVLDDPEMGLVIKTKLRSYSPQYIPELSEVWKSVQATGRLAELIYGPRRNIIFPAEAALTSDMTIGHACGTTAVLEGVLAGTRGILINPYGAILANHDLYAEADIIYSTMDAALEAIRALKAGNPERQGLGDWSSLLDQIDPFRDGQAGRRMREVLKEAVMSPGVPAQDCQTPSVYL